MIENIHFTEFPHIIIPNLLHWHSGVPGGMEAHAKAIFPPSYNPSLPLSLFYNYPNYV